MKYDVFISYRRKNSSPLAMAISGHLTSRGYQVFLDTRDYSSGDLTPLLNETILNSRHVLVLLTDKCLERRSGRDYFFDEIRFALEHGKTLIVATDGPLDWHNMTAATPEMASLRDKKALSFNSDYPDAFLERLEKTLQHGNSGKYGKKLVLSIFAGAATLALAAGLYAFAKAPVNRDNQDARLPRSAHTLGATPTELTMPSNGDSGESNKEATSAERATPTEPLDPVLAARVAHKTGTGEVALPAPNEKLAETPPVAPPSPASVAATAGVIESKLLAVPHDFQMELATIDGRTKYMEGECIQYRVRPSADCHLAVFCRQEDGTTIQLFPNAFNPDTRVRADSDVLVPCSLKSGYAVVVAPPFGTDVVQAIACKEMSEFHVEALKRAKDSPGIPAVSEDAIRKQFDALQEKPSPEKGATSRWAESHLMISTHSRDTQAPIPGH